MEVTFNRALDMLEQLASKAGTAVEQLYPLWVKQAWVESLIGLLVWGTVTGVFFIGASALYRYRKTLCEQDQALAAFWGIIVGLTGAVIFLIACYVNVPGLLNPEYYGTKDLILTIQGVMK